jgi:hypothetical protein
MTVRLGLFATLCAFQLLNPVDTERHHCLDKDGQEIDVKTPKQCKAKAANGKKMRQAELLHRSSSNISNRRYRFSFI